MGCMQVLWQIAAPPPFNCLYTGFFQWLLQNELQNIKKTLC